MSPMERIVVPRILRALRYIVSHGEYLFRLFIEQQVVIAKVQAAHVPVEILRLHIERENVRE